MLPEASLAIMRQTKKYGLGSSVVLFSWNRNNLFFETDPVLQYISHLMRLPGFSKQEGLFQSPGTTFTT